MVKGQVDPHKIYLPKLEQIEQKVFHIKINANPNDLYIVNYKFYDISKLYIRTRIHKFVIIKQYNINVSTYIQ